MMNWGVFCSLVAAFFSIPQTEGLSCNRIRKSEVMGQVTANEKSQEQCLPDQSCLYLTTDIVMNFGAMIIRSPMVMGNCIPTVACNHMGCNSFKRSLGWRTTLENCRTFCCDTNLCNDQSAAIAATLQPSVSDETSFVGFTQVMTAALHEMTSSLVTGHTTADQITCGPAVQILENGGFGILTSPGWPQRYRSNAYCDWTIGAQSDHVIRFTVNSFSTEACCDRLKIIDVGANETLRELSGNVNRSLTFTSRSNHVTARFHSDFSFVDRGFSIELMALEMPAKCYFRRIVQNRKQYLKSPNYPNNYNAIDNCTYQLQSPQGTQIVLESITFRTESCCDKLTIREENRLPAVWAGSNISPSQYISRSNTLELTFISDSSIQYKGFRIAFSILSETTPPPPTTTTPLATNYSVCGVAGAVGSFRHQAARRVGRILGGTNLMESVDRTWPWQVAVSVYGANLVQVYGNNLRGGGTLINNKWVLTAAHLFGFIEQDDGWEQNILLTFGMHTRPRRTRDVLSNIVRVYKADKIKIPDDFDPFTYHYDVALIRLGAQLQFNRRWKEVEDSGFLNFTAYIRPVCLPCMDNNCVGDLLRKERNGVAVLTGNETEEERCRIESQWLANKADDNNRVLAVFTGFGHVGVKHAGGESRPSVFLKQGLLRLRSNDHCNRSTNDIPARIPFTNTMSCATSGLRDRIVHPCQGDAGGPIVREVLDEETKKSCWVQLGIVSWGWGCGQTYVKNHVQVQYPSYYTDVASVMQWIKDSMTAAEYEE